jgi:hypothetical protein
VDNLPQCQSSGSLVDRIFYGELRLYRGKLIRCQSDHGDYAYSRGRVAISGGDVMYSSTRVPIVRRAWVP